MDRPRSEDPAHDDDGGGSLQGIGFAGAGPRMLRRSPPLSVGAFVCRFLLVLYIDAVS
jgi:hypothetical protein